MYSIFCELQFTSGLSVHWSSEDVWVVGERWQAKAALKAAMPASAQVQWRHSFWHCHHGNHFRGGSRWTLRVKKIHSKYVCSMCIFFSPGRVTVKLDAFKKPFSLYISYKYILFTLCSKFTLTFSDLWCSHQFIPPSYLEWHFFL